MDSVSGSLKQSEPCSPNSPGSPDPMYDRRPTSPLTLSTAISSLQRSEFRGIPHHVDCRRTLFYRSPYFCTAQFYVIFIIFAFSHCVLCYSFSPIFGYCFGFACPMRVCIVYGLFRFVHEYAHILHILCERNGTRTCTKCARTHKHTSTSTSTSHTRHS